MPTGRTLPEPTPVVKVAWVMGADLRTYRLPLLQRLSLLKDISVAVFSSSPHPTSPAEEIESGQVPLETTELRAIRWPAGRRKVAWLIGTLRILRGDYDVVICQETVTNLTVWVFALLHRLFRKGLVLHGHGYRSEDSGHLLKNLPRTAARRLLLGNADAIISYTDRGRDACVRLGVDVDRVFVSVNTVDTSRLQTLESTILPSDLAELRSDLGLAAGHVVVFLGRIQPVKRLDVLLDAWRLLEERGFGATLLIVGEGPVRSDLELASHDLNSVRFLGPIYDERRLAAIFKLADVLVIPGRIGLTCVHGFAHGVPAMTTSHEIVPQTPEYDYIEHDVSGIILGQLSPDAYALSIRELLDDGRQLARLHEGARNLGSRLTMDSMANGFVGAVQCAAQAQRTRISRTP